MLRIHVGQDCRVTADYSHVPPGDYDLVPVPAPDLPEVGSWWWWAEGLFRIAAVCPEQIEARSPNGTVTFVDPRDWPGKREPVSVCCPEGHAFYRADLTRWSMADDPDEFWEDYQPMRPYLPCGRVLLPGGRAVEVVGLRALMALLVEHGLWNGPKYDLWTLVPALVGKPLGGGDGE